MAWIGTLIVGWLVADFLSGLLHWLEDRYFREEWPILGKIIAEPNQLHHREPLAFLAHGYWHRNWTTFVPAGIAFAAAWFVHAPAWLLVAIAAASQANEIHAWAHQRCHPVIRAIQETGFLQHPRTHAKHHRSPFDCHYCVMSEWLNPVLDGIGFWSHLEWLIARLTSIQPRGVA